MGLNNARRRHVSRLDCCAAHAKASAGRLPSTTCNSHVLYIDIEMDSLARESFPPSFLQLTFFTSTVICVDTSQINRISLAAVWGTGASRTVVLAYITSIEALLSSKRSTIIA